MSEECGLNGRGRPSNARRRTARRWPIQHVGLFGNLSIESPVHHQKHVEAPRAKARIPAMAYGPHLRQRSSFSPNGSAKNFGGLCRERRNVGLADVELQSKPTRQRRRNNKKGRRHSMAWAFLTHELPLVRSDFSPKTMSYLPDCPW